MYQPTQYFLVSGNNLLFLYLIQLLLLLLLYLQLTYKKENEMLF